ncbi:hypothetical protein G4B88_007707 [Cannabis sativa]|uniref:CCHC-type domain-containing protein n=1 Tax=Cannabis sativa TaxID=3483 RepID=A0A7J6HFN5_CANSA|nr:hypothetical protein G4B88_007707 [Cannabis sativa]
MPQQPDLTIDDLLDRTGNLRVDDEAVWEVNEGSEAEVGKSCLLGRFCSNKTMNRTLIRTILGRVWRLAEVDWGVKIKKVTTEASFMIFSFKNEEDLKRIVNKSPWMLNNGVLILQRFTKMPSKWEEELKRFPLTGRVLNLPTKLITRNNMLWLTAMAGEVIEIQKEDAQKITLNGFFWFKVWISIDKPLCPGFLFPSYGSRVWLPFRYDKLPFMCFSCGYVGHDFRACDKHPEKITDGEGSSTAAYGLWLKVDDKPKENRGKKSIEGDGNLDMNRIPIKKSPMATDVEGNYSQKADGISTIMNSGCSNGELKGIEVVPRITNQNSIHKEVPFPNPSLPCDFMNLMDNFDVKRVEKDFENERGTGCKRRAEVWESTSRGEGPEIVTGKRIHRENSTMLANSDMGSANEGSEWIDIPITLGKNVRGVNSRQKDCNMSNKEPRWRSRFHYEQAWAEEEQCGKIVESVWLDNTNWGSPHGLRGRINLCGEVLKEWNKDKKADLRARTKRLKEELKNLSASSGINEDHWIPRGAPFLLRAPAKVSPNTYVNSLMNDNGEWNLVALEDKIHEDDIPWISGIQTRRVCGEDDLLWHYTINGEYTVASGGNIKQRDSEKLVEDSLALEVNSESEELCVARGTQNKIMKTMKKRDRWVAPKEGTYMLNCDAAVSHGQPGFSIAAVIRDEGGRLVVAEIEFKHGIASVLVAEMSAIKIGLQLVHRMKATPFVLASDSSTAIHQLQSKTTPRADWGMDT